MGLDRALENTRASLTPWKDPKAAMQAAYDPAEFTKKVKVPELETPPPAPTRDDAAASANRKRVRSRASTIFTSSRGDTSAASTSRSVLLGD